MPIVILDNLEYLNRYYYYNKLSFFKISLDESFDITNIVFINFISKDYYKLLNPNKDLIKNRILKILMINSNFIKYDHVENKIVEIINDIMLYIPTKKIIILKKKIIRRN